MGRDLQLFGIGMLVATIIALWFNVTLLARGHGSPALTASLGLVVGVGAYVLGDVGRANG